MFELCCIIEHVCSLPAASVMDQTSSKPYAKSDYTAKSHHLNIIIYQFIPVAAGHIQVNDYSSHHQTVSFKATEELNYPPPNFCAGLSYKYID